MQSALYNCLLFSFFMILILLYRFDTVNSFLALCFIISNLIIVLFFTKAQLFICKNSLISKNNRPHC